MGSRIVIPGANFAANGFAPSEEPVQTREIDRVLEAWISGQDKWVYIGGTRPGVKSILMNISPGDVVYIEKDNTHWGIRSAACYFLSNITNMVNGNTVNALAPVGESAIRHQVCPNTPTGNPDYVNWPPSKTLTAPTGANYLWVSGNPLDNDQETKGLMTPDVLKINGVEVIIPDEDWRIVPTT